MNGTVVVLDDKIIISRSRCVNTDGRIHIQVKVFIFKTSVNFQLTAQTITAVAL